MWTSDVRLGVQSALIFLVVAWRWNDSWNEVRTTLRN